MDRVQAGADNRSGTSSALETTISGGGGAVIALGARPAGPGHGRVTVTVDGRCDSRAPRRC